MGDIVRLTEPVTCPYCGKSMGRLPVGLDPDGEEMGRSLYKMALAHRKSCGGVGTMSRKKKAEAMAQEPVAPVQPEVQPEPTETNADVIVAQRLEAESEARRADSDEPTAMESLAAGLAGVQPKRGRLQKGDYPVWLQKINAERLEARNKRIAEKAAAREAKKAEKEAAKS